MALKSETASPPDGMVNVINQKSSGDGEDLEDGEIFDDDDDVPVPAPVQTPVPPSPPSISNPDDKKKLSPVRKTVPRQRRATKRPRDEERPFRSSKQRRRSEESDKSRDKPFLSEDEDIREFSPLRIGPDWDRGHHRPVFDDMDDDDDELGRRGRGFENRRRGRNGRGGIVGRRGMGRRENTQICKFFLQGKCQRGSECPFSHSQRKFEVCKFYIKDCCVKKDRCPFLHSEFPCKYYYLGMKCFAGKKCKFTHGKISSQLRANLLRDSKEHIDSPPPKEESGRSRRERDRDRERDREYRDREHRDKDRDRSKDRDRERERDRKGDKDRFTLHFKVDPRTVSDEEESRTPMPSPSQATSSDRGSRSPEVVKKEPSPKVETPALPESPKDNGFSGEELPDFIPADLPKHQRELYKRIQQHHNREASNAKTEVEEVEKETEDYKDEDWYSSEEEENTKKLEPLTALLNKLKQQPPVASVPRQPSPPKQNTAPPQIIVPPILPDFDISAVSKLLSTVRETIQQKQQISKSGEALAQTGVPPKLPLPSNTVATSSAPSVPTVIPPSLNPLPPLASLVAEPTPSAEKRRMRDPRLRGNSTDDDVDLRMGPRGDVDLRQLPFKPAPVHTPASEIDASVTSHPPVIYRLISISPPPPPDYSSIHPKNANDPRLKKHAPGALPIPQPMIPPVVPLKTTLEPPRDPRQRSMVAKDPRRKSSLLFQRDSDLRQPPQNFNLVNDVDLRMHPPAPHLAFK